ncbi:hypothetical protein [Williamsia sp. 1138]|uniref:hypothetical protein n=1 Tax=Williamsia sp. 1138 TaxID=1903117 RepID=UPI00143CC80F|nr:hypothetical protein [Williamsia sp. 1138]
MAIEVQVNPVDENTVEDRIVLDGRGSRIRTTAPSPGLDGNPLPAAEYGTPRPSAMP